MWGEDLRNRTKSFTVRVMKLVNALPVGRASDIIGRQLLRAGAAVDANYRAACRARSVADFIASMGMIQEETDECLYWMSLLLESGVLPDQGMQELRREAEEIREIAAASISPVRSAVNA